MKEQINIEEIEVNYSVVTYRCDDPEEEKDGGIGGNQGDPNEEEEPPGIEG